MTKVAPGLHLLDGRPRYGFNVYLAGDVLVDSGTRWARRRILRQLRGVNVRALALTHCHVAHELCAARSLPLWAGVGDAEAMESGKWQETIPSNPVTLATSRLWGGPPHPAARGLHEGDEVADFRVIETPGHSPGHLSFWRESDRVLIAGDSLFHRHPLTGATTLMEPPAGFTLDPEANRRSIHRLCDLDPAIVCFGHGPPLRLTDTLGDIVRRDVKGRP